MQCIFREHVRRGQGRAAGAAAGHMEWMQEFGKLCIAYGIELQHIRSDFNYQRASRSLLRQVYVGWLKPSKNLGFSHMAPSVTLWGFPGAI